MRNDGSKFNCNECNLVADNVLGNNTKRVSNHQHYHSSMSDRMHLLIADSGKKNSFRKNFSNKRRGEKGKSESFCGNKGTALKSSFVIAEVYVELKSFRCLFATRLVIHCAKSLRERSEISLKLSSKT
jgi:hypothetical protein